MPLAMIPTPLIRDVKSGIHLSPQTCSFIIPLPFTAPDVAMSQIHYTLLDEPLWPLMNKFYRAHQSSMKAVREAQLWVARRDEIIAALCLRPVSG